SARSCPAACSPPMAGIWFCGCPSCRSPLRSSHWPLLRKRDGKIRQGDTAGKGIFMSDIVEIGLKAAAVGIGGTLALDLWAFLLQRVFHTPATNWAMVGRWIGHMPKGQFVQ